MLEQRAYVDIRQDKEGKSYTVQPARGCTSCSKCGRVAYRQVWFKIPPRMDLINYSYLSLNNSVKGTPIKCRCPQCEAMDTTVFTHITQSYRR